MNFLLFSLLILSGETILGQQRLYPIKTKDHRIGFIDGLGKKIFEPKFDYLKIESYFGYHWIHSGGKNDNSYVKGGKWGLIKLGSFNDRMIVEPQFDWIGNFSEGMAPVLVGDKWGFIDTMGRMRISPQFQDNETPDFEPERMRTWNREQIQENWFYDPNYPDRGHKIDGSQAPSWFFTFINGSAWIKTSKGATLIDTAGTIIKIVKRTFFESGHYRDFQSSVFEEEKLYGVIDRQGNPIVPLQNKRITSVLSYQKRQNWIAIEIAVNPAVVRWGLMTLDGQWRILPEFENVRIRNHLFWIQKNKLWGLIDSNGKSVIEPQFDKIEHFYEYGMKVQKNKKWGLVSNEGTIIFDCRFDELGYPDEGIAKIVVSKKIGFINRVGKIIAEPQFRHSEYPRDGFVWASTDSGWCALNREGKVVVQPNRSFQYVYGFDQGIAWFRYDDRYGLVDTTGKIILDPTMEFRNPCSFTQGLGWVQKEKEWSLIDMTGRTIFKIKCDSAADFDGELAKIWIDGKTWGYVNRKGEVVWKGN